MRRSYNSLAVQLKPVGYSFRCPCGSSEAPACWAGRVWPPWTSLWWPHWVAMQYACAAHQSGFYCKRCTVQLQWDTQLLLIFFFTLGSTLFCWGFQLFCSVSGRLSWQHLQILPFPAAACKEGHKCSELHTNPWELVCFHWVQSQHNPSHLGTRVIQHKY